MFGLLEDENQYYTIVEIGARKNAPGKNAPRKNAPEKSAPRKIAPQENCPPGKIPPLPLKKVFCKASSCYGIS